MLSGFVLGLGTAVILAIVWLVLDASRGPVRAVSYTYAHQVGETKYDNHGHRYSAWNPGFVRRIRFAIDRRRCVFGRLQMTAGAVWDAEVRYLAEREWGLEPEGVVAAKWYEAEQLVIDAYDLGPLNISDTVSYHTDRVLRMARAQLARREATVLLASYRTGMES